MRKYLFLILFLLVFISLQNSQAQNKSEIIKSMSIENKLWAIANASCVKRALDMSEDVLHIMDSLYKQNFFDTDSEGSSYDAFRHVFWMYSLASEIGIEKARKIGIIYEDYNQYVFSINPQSGYDATGRKMDEFNNELGLFLFSKIGKQERDKVIESIRNLISKGYAKIIAKDEKENSLDENHEVIPQDKWKGKWENERCLINSNVKL